MANVSTLLTMCKTLRIASEDRTLITREYAVDFLGECQSFLTYLKTRKEHTRIESDALKLLGRYIEPVHASVVAGEQFIKVPLHTYLKTK